MPQLKKTMFREYDLRGRESDDELNDQALYFLGRGFGTFLHKNNITEAIVGHDARATSESFQANMVKGLLESGINVIDIGTVTTPLSYWAQHHLKVKGLAMITASHNPVGWNGVKFGLDLSKTLLGYQIQEVYQIIANENFVIGKGAVKKEDITDSYIKDILSKANITKKFKILINTGNGTAGLFYSEIFKKAGQEVIEHNKDVDPTYPNYTPNPENKDMMEDTVKQTLKHKADLGLAFDGDGDRMGVVDEKGRIINADRYLILLSRLVLSKQTQAKIIFDVKVSEALPEDIKAHDGIPIMWMTGHSFIKTKMAEENAALAGEMSGHIFFSQDYYGFDDAAFAALKLLEYLSTQNKPLSQVIDNTPYYISTPTIHVHTTDEDKFNIVDELTKEFKQEGYNVLELGGTRVYTKTGGWGLVRASNTNPMLVLRFEAKTQKELDELQDMFRKKLDRFEIVNKEWIISG